MSKVKARYSILALSLYLCHSQIFAQEAEFDNSFLYGDHSKNIDLNQLISSDRVAVGHYILDLYLNDKYITRSNVIISDNPNTSEKQRYCIPVKTVKQLDFSPKLIDLNKVSSDCIDTRLMNHVVFWKLNIAQQRLDISSPQAMLNERPQGYISPNLWENGSNTSFLKYYLNYYNTDSGHNSKQNSGFLNLNSGINISDWQLRHSGSTTFSNDNKSNNNGRYISYETKLLRAIPSLKSQLTLGDFYTNSSTFNSNSSIAIRGGQLASDDRMLPLSLQNYAPTISGYANSNALIRVRQNQQIIMERTVPAGEFNIQDLQTPGNSGVLNVDIVEANGQVRSFDVPYSNFIQSIRARQHRYQIAVGSFRRNSQFYDEKLINTSFDYGLNNLISLNTNALISEHYQSYILGSSINSIFGGIGLEANYVKAKLSNFDKDLNSHSISLRYNLSFNQMKSNLSFNSTHYANENFHTFDEVMQNIYIQKDQSAININAAPKSLNFIQYSQMLNPNFGSISANYTTYNYWNNNKRTSYQLSYSNHYKDINYYLGVQHTQSTLNHLEEDTQYFINIDFPLFKSKKNTKVRFSSEQYSNNSDRSTTQVGLFGNLGEKQQLAYNFNYANAKNQDSLSSSLSYQSTPISLSSTFTTNFNNQRQYSLQAQGAIVAHKYGLTLTNNLSDTFAIVHADGLEGSLLSNGSRIDGFGNAVIPYLTPYQYNILSLDSNSIPLKTNVTATQIQVIPKSNASVLVHFDTSHSSSALIQLISGNATNPIPMGSTVMDSLGNTVTFVGQGQQIFLQDVKATTYKVNFNQSESCTFTITNEMLKNTQSTQPFTNFSLNCL